MIIVLRHGVSEQERRNIVGLLEGRGFRVREIQGEEDTVLGAVGLARIDIREVELLPGVSRVIPITQPFKMASREYKREDTVVQVGPVRIGGGRLVVIAGPCAVESRQQILEAAHRVKESGAVLLRGGAYKPRTSPYDFQGLGEEGLRYLKEAGEATGLPVVSEIVSPDLAERMKEYVDVLQIGARNMQNFELLKKVGPLGKPVLLKRGLAATIQELLMAAEYLMAHGASAVILCERGIRTFESYTRNTLDLSAIPVVKKLSHLPILVDPSHGTGLREKVLPMGLAAVAAGADGLTVEVHPDPEAALSDGPQSLYPEQFEKLMRDIEALAPVLGKEVARLPQQMHLSAGAARDRGTGGRAGRAAARAARQGREVLRVAFQGERGAFSQKAIFHAFPDGTEAVPRAEFRDVFDAVLEGECDFGVLPLENSLTGSIHQNYDLLLRYPDLRIVGEKTIRIIHNLIVLPEAELADIRRVYSHPQGLFQCAAFLEGHPDWQQVPYYDTAGAVAFVAREGRRENAAIAGEEAALVHGMKILKSGIETNSRNYTRFVIVAREDRAPAGGRPEKASLVFATADKPGALYSALTILAERRINMKKLESRPIPGKPWQYMFYVDVDVPQEAGVFDQALEALRAETQDFRVLGMYPL